MARGPGLRAKLLAAFLLPTCVVLAVGGVALYRTSRGVLERQLGEALAGTAAALASQLKAERVLSLTAEDAAGEGSRTYRALKAQLTDARAAAGLGRVLVFDMEHKARLDVGGPLLPGAEVYEVLRDERELKAVQAGERLASQVLFKGTDGQYYLTGYAPIRADGHVVAVVAVEGSAEFFGPLASLRWGFFALTLAALLALALAAAWVSRTLSVPLERLVASALRIGAGDLKTPVPPEPTREIGVLSRELEAMRQSLESRDRQLKLMLGGVAHEVKNPLGGIELFTGLLAEELDGGAPNLADAKAHLGHVRKELDYLKRIVEDFLAYARERPLNLDALDASGLLHAAAGHLEGEARAKGVLLVVNAEPATVRGDESLLTGALVNLVKNAVQASAQGQTVRVVGAKAGAAYQLAVHDEGHGVPADALPHIFEPFFTTREKGTGLGLPLAKKLFEAHGGTLAVTSAPGATRFTATLPLG